MSDITIGNLVIQMSANVARLTSDMAQARSTVVAATDQMSSAAESAMHALEAIGLGLSLNEFAEFVKHTSEAAEHLLNLQKATGIAVESLAGLSLLAKQNGTDIDSLAKAVEKLSVNMGKTPEDFKALGVSARDPMEAFKQLADVFNLIPDIQTRNAVAMKALGKSWAEVAPVMSLGSEEIGKTVEKGLALSHMTTDLAVQSKAFNDKWVELVGTGGLANQMLSALLPVLTSLADDFIAVRDGAGGTGAAFDKFGAAVASGVTTTKEAVIWLYNHRDAVEAVGGAYASWKIAAWLAPLITGFAEATVVTYEKITADIALKAATLASAEANVAATASTVALTTARVAELRAAVLATEGAVALEIATNGLVPAQARATAAELAHVTAIEALVVAQEGASITAAAAGGALTLLGGPVGAIILLLGLAATAWFAFGDSGKTALDKLIPSADDAQTRLDKINQTLKYGAGERGQIEAQLAAISAKKSELYQQEDYFVHGQLAELDKTKATLLAQVAALDALDAKQKEAAGSSKELTAEQKAAAQAAADFLAKGTQAANDQINKYNSLVDRVNAYAAQLTLAVDQNKNVTEGEKLNLAVKDMLKESIVGVTDEMKIGLQVVADYIAQKEAARQAQLDQIKADKEYEAEITEIIKVLDEVGKSTDAYALKQKEYVDALKTSIAEIGMDAQAKATTTAMAEIDKALEREIARVTEFYGKIGDEEGLKKAIGELNAWADKTKAVVTDLIAFKIAKERDWVTGTNQAFMEYVSNATNAATQAKNFWTAALTGMEDLLTKFFMTGKLGFKDFIAVVEQQLAKMAAQQIVVSIVGNVGGGAAGSAAGSAGGSILGSAVSAGAGSLFGAAGTVGSVSAGSVMTAAPVYEAGVMVSGAEAASIGSAAGATAAGAGLYSTLAAIPVYGWIAMAVVAAYEIFSKDGGGPQVGQYGSASAAGYSSSFTMSGGDPLGNQTATFGNYADAQTLAALAGHAGALAGLQINQGYKLDPQGTAPGLAYRSMSLNGQQLTPNTFDGNNGANYYTGSNDSAGVAAYLGKLNDSDLMTLVQAIGDPKLVTVAQTLEATFGNLTASLPAYLNAQAAQKSLSLALMTTAEQQASKLADEQTAINQTFASLNVAVPSSVEAFRALVNGLDLTTTEGQKTLAAFSAIAPAFLDVANAAATATGTLATQARTAADIASERAGLQTQLDNLMMTATQLAAQQRAALDASNQALFDQVQAMTRVNSAKASLLTAYNTETTAIQATMTSMGSFVTSLTGFRDGLVLGNLSPLTPQDKYTAAQAQYEVTLSAAQGTGPEATTAQGNLQNAATAFLTASQVVNASSSTYQADFKHVMDSTGLAVTWAQQQVALSQTSLDQLKLQVGSLININAGVQSVAQAIANLSVAMASLSPRNQASQIITSNATAMSYMPSLPGGTMEQLITTYMDKIATLGFAATQAQFNQDVATYAAANPFPSHATGLAYVPHDGYRAELHQGEQILTAPQALDYKRMGTINMAPLVAEIKALREEVKGLRAEQKDQTGAIIGANYDANDKAASKVSASTLDASKTAAWVSRTKAVIA